MTSMFWNTATRWVATKLNGLSHQVPPPPRAPDDTEKRKVLLVHAHPLSGSFSRAIADAVEAGAKEGGHEVRRRSLYEEGYAPQLTASERAAYHEPSKGAARFPKDTRRHLADLRWCDTFVVVYPTWWFNMPAMLKGYFDRTFVPGRDGAFDLPSGPNDPEAAGNGLVPRLTNVKRMLGVSTYGASRSIAFLAGDNGRNTIGTAIRPSFAKDCTCRWLGLYNMDGCAAGEREAFLAEVKRVVRDEL